MELKRHYRKPEGWTRRANTRDMSKVERLVREGATIQRAMIDALEDPRKPEGACLNPPPLSHIEVRRAGPTQKFSTGLVEAALAEGWMTIAAGVITINGKPDSVRYRIVRGPGHYCLSCGEKLDGQAAARTHVADAHPGTRPEWPRRSRLVKTDPEQRHAQNPSGYERIDHYECERVEE